MKAKRALFVAGDDEALDFGTVDCGDAGGRDGADSRERRQAAAESGTERSQRRASSICCGVQPYSSARLMTDSRALKREAIIAVEIPVPVSTGLPNPTKGLISIVLGSEEVGATTKGKKWKRP